MKIVEQTASKLTLRSPGLGAWISGVIFISIGIISPFFGKDSESRIKANLRIKLDDFRQI